MSANELLAMLRNQFNGKENTEELIDCVTDLLPGDTQFSIVSVKGTIEQYRAKVDLNLNSLEEIALFVSKYVDKNM